MPCTAENHSDGQCPPHLYQAKHRYPGFVSTFDRKMDRCRFWRLGADRRCRKAKKCPVCNDYAVAAIKSGDDIKTVQENLGHATAAFTLDVYGHVTNQMKQASASRMEHFISTVSS